MTQEHHETSNTYNNITPVIPAVPGTEVLYDSGQSDGNNLQHLQHVKNGNSHILLVPQPSLTDPDDPLRWPAWRKSATFANALAYSFLGGVTGPIMSAMMIPLSVTFEESLQRMTYAVGATLIGQGIGNIFWMPLSIKFGRRPVYLASNTLMGAACIWLGVASELTYTNFILGRVFLGLFEAPIESIVPSTIRDIYFLHHRGSLLSLYALSVLGGNELGPMFSAIIFQALGSKWAFFIVAFFIFATTTTMVFFMPETLYYGKRPSIVSHVGDKTFAAAPSSKPEVETAEDRADTITPNLLESSLESRITGNGKGHSFFGGLALWNKPDPSANLLKDFLRPFMLLTYPTIIWACVVYGCSLGWNVIIGATVAQLFGGSQYGFHSQAQGLIFLSPLLGSFVGTWVCGPAADAIANIYTVRNDGIREPEMRLPACIFAAALTFFGALLAGLTYHYNTHWIGPISGLGVLTAGAQIGATLSMNYVLDCHTQLSVELMVTVASLKSLLAWIFTWVINDWIDVQGMFTVFMIVAAINVFVYGSTIPLYFYGKKVRWWIVRADLLGKAELAP